MQNPEENSPNPSTTEANGNQQPASQPAGQPVGRGKDGKFAPGNKCARGNPHGKKVAQLRTAMLGAVSQKDFRLVFKKMLELAKKGDTTAAKILVDRMLGPPHDIDYAERFERLEDLIFGDSPR